MSNKDKEIEEVTEIVDNFIERELQNIVNLWCKAKKFKELETEQIDGMTKIYENLSYLEPIIRIKYNNNDETRMFEAIDKHIEDAIDILITSDLNTTNLNGVDDGNK